MSATAEVMVLEPGAAAEPLDALLLKRKSNVPAFPEQSKLPSPALTDEPDSNLDNKPVPPTRRNRAGLIAGLLLSASVIAAGYIYWEHSRHFESTDDAFIAARSFAIAPKVTGYITSVPVTDNQHVAAGSVIARIDDRDYRAALDQANAQLARDQAVLAQAQKNLARYEVLVSKSAVSQQTYDDQSFLVEQDKATVAVDEANVETAKLNLSHTVINAAQAGRVVSLTGAVGQYAQAGTSLTMFVPDDIWVTANFKESQLNEMRPGQPITLVIDAYPGRVFHGSVASIQAGSGTAFSLLPAQNATGNYVKIVQRVPVKIVLEDAPADVAIGPGMSVVPTVRVNPNPSIYEYLRGLL